MITNGDGLEHSHTTKHLWTTWNGEEREKA